VRGVERVRNPFNKMSYLINTLATVNKAALVGLHYVPKQIRPSANTNKAAAAAKGQTPSVCL